MTITSEEQFMAEFDHQLATNPIRPFVSLSGQPDDLAFAWTESYVRRWVSSLDRDHMSMIVDSMHCNPRVCRYFARFWVSNRCEAPFGDKEGQALYWTTVSVMLTDLFSRANRLLDT
ncbi:MAG TPA: hypothetical protein PK096_04500 [Candidatus Saccharibacteria bacterium]|nr:hypothetical protein [Candidatus Saccharibacteria bacterium]HRK94598.1 hypothetical protein [Candidatus Saccharibacteria bacterium]